MHESTDIGPMSKLEFKDEVMKQVVTSVENGSKII